MTTSQCYGGSVADIDGAQSLALMATLQPSGGSSGDDLEIYASDHEEPLPVGRMSLSRKPPWARESS